MAPDHLVADGVDNVGKAEVAGFLGHACMEHDLQQQVAQFVAQIRIVAPVYRIGHFVGFLDRVRRDRGEILLHVPRTAGLRIAQCRHDAQQVVDSVGSHARRRIRKAEILP